MKLLLLLLLFALPSYGRDSTIVITQDTDNNIAKNVVYDVVDLNKRIGKNKFTFVDNFTNYRIFISYNFQPKGNIAGEAVKYLFYCRITLYPPSYNVFKTTVWHEIGHCLGMDHEGYVGHIMSEKVKSFKEYSQEEIDTFVENVKRRVK